MLSISRKNIDDCLGFARRHKGAIALACLVGAGVVAYFRVNKVLDQVHCLQLQYLEQHEKQRRMNSYNKRTKSESLQAIENLIPILKKRVYSNADISGPVRALKLLRQSQDLTGASDSKESDLWDDTKVLGLTRLLLSLYTLSALSLMLRLQISIIGRYNFESDNELLRRNSWQFERHDYIEDLAEKMISLPTDSRRAFLSCTYEYFLGDGLRDLASDLILTVRSCSIEWHCQSKLNMTRNELFAMLNKVRSKVECCPEKLLGSNDTRAYLENPFLRYIINPDAHEQMNSEKIDIESSSFFEVLKETKSNGNDRAMLNETWDAVESPNFGLALKDSFDCCFKILHRRIQEHIFTGDNRDEELSPPLVSVLSSFKVLVAEIFNPVSNNEYIECTSDVQSVKELCLLTFAGVVE